MSVKCFLIEPAELSDTWIRKDTGEQHAHVTDFGAGAMWAHDWFDEPGYYVLLPNNAGIWHTCQPASGTNQRWNVSGDAPVLTVTPSINAEPAWHGWLTNGELTP